MKITLSNVRGHVFKYGLSGTPLKPVAMPQDGARVVFSAAHLVRDPFSDVDPSGNAAKDWDTKSAARRSARSFAENRFKPSG